MAGAASGPSVGDTTINRRGASNYMILNPSWRAVQAESLLSGKTQIQAKYKLHVFRNAV